MSELAVRGQWTVAELATGIESAWPAWKAAATAPSEVSSSG
jgi:hypothetical protein